MGGGSQVTPHRAKDPKIALPSTSFPPTVRQITLGGKIKEAGERGRGGQRVHTRRKPLEQSVFPAEHTHARTKTEMPRTNFGGIECEMFLEI